MPESPEVDALAGFLRRAVSGRRIATVELDEFRALKTRDRPLGELVGHEVTGVRRFGKHLAIDTHSAVGVGPSLLISFGRAGWARWAEDPAAPPPEGAPPTIARIGFDTAGGPGDAELAITDAGDWLSLGLSVVDDATSVPAVAKLGPDPLAGELDQTRLDRLLIGRRKQLKALLQEQESIAGIGNAYSDEILHVARLSPVEHAAALDEGARTKLGDAIRDVITTAAAARRDVPIDQQKAAKVASMRVHGRAGEACPVCGDTVLDIPGTKSGAQYCPTCQTHGVPLPA